MNLLRSAPDAKPGTIFGIRPEHLDVVASGWALHVEAVEMLGAERLVYARLNNETVIVRIDEGRKAPQAGEVIHVSPRPDRVHLFDATTGRRL